MTNAIAEATLLVVDDEVNVRKALKRLLNQDGYRIILAEDGLSGLQKLRENHVDLIISDARMPGMDGITFLSKANDMQPHSAQILLTGTSDIPLLQDAVNDCQLDRFLTKPWGPKQLRATVQTVLKENSKTRQSEHSREALMRELGMAADMQIQPLLNCNVHRNLKFEWLYEPCSVLAGDGIGLRQEGEKALFYLLDVVGHGPAAAMESFALQQILASYGPSAPEWIAEDMNQIILDKNQPMNYFTMIYGDLDVNSGNVRLCQAGHPHPIHWRRRDGSIKIVGEGGFPIGLFNQASFTRIEFKLEPGDRLFFFSDGLLDMGLCAMTHLIETHKDKSLCELKEKIHTSRMIMPVDDDISLLAMEWLP